MLATQILDKVTLSDSLPITNPTHKTCTKCHQSKLLCEFHKNKKCKYGVRPECKVCKNEHYQTNREIYIENCKAWKQANKKRYLEYTKAWYESNRERHLENCKVWREANPENRKSWREANPDKCRSYGAKRRAIKKLAFPIWARTGEIKTQIDAIYKEAKDLELFHETTYHVDHIVPLQSNFVCGLHVPANLQPLPGIENISKSNSFVPYIENSSEIEIDMVELRKMVKDFLAIETWVTMYTYSKTILFLKLL